MVNKSNTECPNCKWNDECVNVNKFKDGDCLQWSGQKREKEKPVKKPQPSAAILAARKRVSMIFDYKKEVKNE